MTDKDIVEVTISLKLPKKAYDFFDQYARFDNISVEELFKIHLMSILTNYADGGYTEGFMEGINDHFNKEILPLLKDEFEVSV